MIGRPIPVLTLTDEERAMLERWARRPTTAQALAQRARVRARSDQHACRARAAADQTDRRQMAQSVSGRAPRRVAG
jgi:hypothetical protein